MNTSKLKQIEIEKANKLIGITETQKKFLDTIKIHPRETYSQLLDRILVKIEEAKK
jgi:hypothetical protein